MCYRNYELRRLETQKLNPSSMVVMVHLVYWDRQFHICVPIRLNTLRRLKRRVSTMVDESHPRMYRFGKFDSLENH
jgi:hypothetical protein